MDQKRKHKTMFLVRWSIFCIAIWMTLSSIAFAADTTKVYVGANEVKFKQSTYKENGKIWVEVSSLVPKLGGKYFWNKAKSKLTIVSRPGNSVSYFVGQKKAFYGNQKEEISFAPVLKGGQVMMPLDEVAKNCNQAYKIDEANGMIYLFDMDRLVMDTLLEKKVIKDEFYYISDWWYEDPDLIVYELRRNTFSEGTASLVDRYSYQLSTGELHKLVFESDKKELVGKYPVNSQTAEKYKSNGWIKFDLGYSEGWKYVGGLIFDTIQSASDQGRIKKKSFQMSELTPKQRGRIIHGVIMNDYPTNKIKLMQSTELQEQATIPLDLKKTEEFSKLVLGGSVDLKEFLIPHKTKKNLLIAASGGTIESVQLKYRKIEGNRLIIKGEMGFYVEEIPEILGDFTAVFEQNKKSPINGYILKNVDYTYYK